MVYRFADFNIKFFNAQWSN